MRILDRPSPNSGPRPPGAVVDMLILHYTGMPTAEAALERLTAPDAKVSAHYLVEEDGRIWRLVPEARRAWHAGAAAWRGRRDINDVSVGIELVNPGHEWGYRPFPEPQMAALEALCRDILSRHAIPGHFVLGHSDVAPTRKEDPGELFDWPRLARGGIGIWPEEPWPAAPPAASVPDLLRRVGYVFAASELPKAVTAFQRHFRPRRPDGIADPETRRRVAAVAALAGNLT